jgi:nucleoside-diphosphate-sugar epimerase
LRPSTVFGPSPRFRSDIIVNNFIGSAIVEKKINILSDGTPWRPVVHINDLCKIIVRSLKLNILPFNGQAVNVGYKDGNFTVLELAKKISKIFKGIEICHSNKPKLDQRTYKVNFDKLYSIFGKNIITVKNFDKQCTKLKNFLIDNNFNKAKFYSYVTNRILRLKKIFK